MPDIFDNAINDGLAAVGKTATALPLPANTPPPSVPAPPAPSIKETVAPVETIQAPVVKDTSGADDKVSIEDFGDAFKKPAKVESAKPAEHKVEPVKPAVQPLTQTKPDSRDAVLTELKIPAEKLDLFKRMPNDTFNEVVKVIKERQEKETEVATLNEKLKNSGQLPQSYFEHPEGYMLHPKVKEAQQIVTSASRELQHWNEQYDKIVAGEEWTDLDIDPKSGQYVFTKKAHSPAAQREVMGYIQNARQAIKDNAGYVEDVKSQWTHYHKQYVGAFQAAAEQYFPQYKGKTDNTYINTMHKLLAEKGQQSNPLTPMFAMMYASLMEAQQELTGLKAAKSSGTPVAAQPPSSAFNGGSSPKNAGEETVGEVMGQFNSIINAR